jgi:inorganic triphosphatase YgiF
MPTALRHLGFLRGKVDSIEHGYGLASADLMKKMAGKRVFFVATEEASDDPKMDEIYARLELSPEQLVERRKRAEQYATHSAERLRNLVAAGVQIAFGSDVYYSVKGLSRGHESLYTLHA